MINVNGNETRIAKLGDYLLNIIDTIIEEVSPLINADWLSNEINNYSLDKIPTVSTVEKWVLGVSIHKDVYNFRCRFPYSSDRIDNLKNIGFFEMFENTIKDNNEKGVLPNIDGIQEIECLNCGTMRSNTTNTAEFYIQIQIKYIVKGGIEHDTR